MTGAPARSWTFHNITLSLERPHGGGVVVTLGSDNAEHPWAPDRVDQADTRRLSQHRSLKPAKWRRTICCWRRAFDDGTCRRPCRCRPACAARSAPTACRNPWSAGSSPMPASSATPTIPTAASISTTPNSRSIGMPATACLSVPFQIVSGGNRITLHGRGPSAAAVARSLDVQDRRRHDAVEFTTDARRSAGPQSHRAERAIRSGQEALRPRRRRLRQ